MHLLQHDPDRLELYRQIAPFRALPELDCIGVTDPDLIAAIFRSPSFHVVDYGAGARRIMERTGLDLSATIKAFDNIPLGKENLEHKQLREKMAAVFAAKLNVVETRLAETMASIIAEKFVDGRRIDLVGDLATPIYNTVFSILLNVDISAVEQRDEISMVFDRQMSLNRRKALDAGLVIARQDLARQEDTLATSIDLAIALSILGKDTLIGSLVVSLWHEFKSQPGLTLDAMNFPAMMPSTAVPYIERIAVEDVSVGALTVAKGQRVRLLLDATTREALGDDAGVMFGKGRHLCIGRPTALLAWKTMTGALSALPFRVTAGEMTLRKGDYVFTYPTHAWIGLGL